MGLPSQDGASCKRVGARPARPVIPVAPLTLEVNASCPGLSGREELPSLLHELASAAANQLQLCQGCILTSVGMRITIEPLEEWCSFRDLAIPSSCGQSVFRSFGTHEVHSHRAAVVHTELEALFHTASEALTLDTTGCTVGGWSSIRRIAVQLSLRELPTLLPNEETQPLASSAAPLSRTTKGALLPPSRHRRRWRAGMLKRVDLAQLPAESKYPTSGDARCATYSTNSRSNKNTASRVCQTAPDSAQSPQDLTAVDLRSQTALASGAGLAHSDSMATDMVQVTQNSPVSSKGSPSVEVLCSQPRNAMETESCRHASSDLAVAAQIRAARSSSASANALTLVEKLRLCCMHGGRMPGTARHFIQLVMCAKRPQGFQDFASALWVLLRQQEFDVAVTALRVLRSSIAASDKQLANDTGVHAAIVYFNTLLRELSKAFAEAMHGSAIGVSPLTETVSQSPNIKGKSFVLEQP